MDLSYVVATVCGSDAAVHDPRQRLGYVWTAAIERSAAGGILDRMPVQPHEIQVKTQGNNQVLNITDQVADCIGSGKITNGNATVFVIGSTAGITTTEFEPGLVKNDLNVAFEGIAPQDARYLHEETWHDDNGHSHVRAALLGPSLTIPIIDRQLQLGTWQQIVLIDFDTRPRDRRIIVQVVGE